MLALCEIEKYLNLPHNSLPKAGYSSQVEALEAELSGARKSAAGKATEMAELSKRLSDSLARGAKVDDKVGMPALTTHRQLSQTYCAKQ